MKHTYHVHVPMRRVGRWWRVVWRHVVTWLASSTTFSSKTSEPMRLQRLISGNNQVALSASPLALYERKVTSALLSTEVANSRRCRWRRWHNTNDVTLTMYFRHSIVASLALLVRATTGCNQNGTRPPQLLSLGQNSWYSGALITEKWQRVSGSAACYFSWC